VLELLDDESLHPLPPDQEHPPHPDEELLDDELQPPQCGEHEHDWELKLQDGQLSETLHFPQLPQDELEPDEQELLLSLLLLPENPQCPQDPELEESLDDEVPQLPGHDHDPNELHPVDDDVQSLELEELLEQSLLELEELLEQSLPLEEKLENPLLLLQVELSSLEEDDPEQPLPKPENEKPEPEPHRQCPLLLLLLLLQLLLSLEKLQKLLESVLDEEHVESDDDDDPEHRHLCLQPQPWQAHPLRHHFPCDPLRL